MPRERYRIGDLTLDVDAVSLTRDDGAALSLPKLSFDLLVALARGRSP
jgi:DNA-binding response OmpR family regulator